ncbi:hypothetical protein TcasGA2_TC032529 [Tribolium castaneum]|uniref:Secreted protein n=1 Tax=Tribolium castaneum TaxID=7070 RepID=A0A139WCK4_TRICA|nr:hypothetical protein TcasGA2_TC032529 [Tribolium castaneum]
MARVRVVRWTWIVLAGLCALAICEDKYMDTGSRKNKSAVVARNKYVQCVCLSCRPLFGLEMRQFVWTHSVR